MNRSESKYFNTALRMDNALLELLKEKNLEFITVKEICSRAGVNRSTFYLHYETIDDLLSECVEATNNSFLSYFKELEHSDAFIEKIRELPLHDLILISDEYLLPYLRFVKENQIIFSAAVNSPSAMRSVGKFEGLYLHIIEPIMERFGYPADERKYAVSFFMSGIVAVITDWLKDGCAEPIEKISGIIIRCIRPYHNTYETI